VLQQEQVVLVVALRQGTPVLPVIHQAHRHHRVIMVATAQPIQPIQQQAEVAALTPQVQMVRNLLVLVLVETAALVLHRQFLDHQ